MRWACQEVASRAEEEDSSTNSSPKLSSISPGILAVSPWFVLLNLISRFAFLVPFSLPIANCNQYRAASAIQAACP